MHCCLCDPLTSSLSRFHCHELAGSPLDAHVWLHDYSELAGVLRRAKYARESSHYTHLAGYLARAIMSLSLDKGNLIMAYIPTITSHIRSRGNDHAQILARSVSRNCGISLTPALVASHDKAQVRSDANSRHVNPHYLPTRSLHGATVVLIDDIATTRTTLEHGARALRASGAHHVIGATLAYRSYLT